MKIIALSEDNFVTILIGTNIKPLQLAQEIEKANAASETRYIFDDFYPKPTLFDRQWAVISEDRLRIIFDYDVTTVHYKWTEVKPR